jgi:mevalonate kinase
LISVASAPAKVILFGEHFIVYGGKAILCSINKRVTVRSQLVTSDKIEIRSNLGSVEISKNENLKKVDSLFRPIVYLAQKIQNQFKSDSGIKISINSEIPAGVGLGSSSACYVATASSIWGLFAKHSRQDILPLAIDAEKTVFENASGADPTICAYGGMMEYSRNEKTRKLRVTPKFRLVVANSNVLHSTAEVVSKVRKFKESKPEIFLLLCKQESDLIEEAFGALEKNDLIMLGQKMQQNQTYLQQIGVSNDRLDTMIKAVGSVSYGAKLTGAGDGGCIIALVDETNQTKAIDALSNYECFIAQIDMVGLKHEIDNTV